MPKITSNQKVSVDKFQSANKFQSTNNNYNDLRAEVHKTQEINSSMMTPVKFRKVRNVDYMNSLGVQQIGSHLQTPAPDKTKELMRLPSYDKKTFAQLDGVDGLS